MALADLAELRYDKGSQQAEAAVARTFALLGQDRNDEATDPTTRAVRRALRIAALGAALALIAYVIYGVASVYL